MSASSTDTGTHLTLDLWHPNCWAIQATAEHAGGIIAHAVYETPTYGTESSTVTGLYTAYADSERELTRLIEAIGASPLVGAIDEIQTQFDTRRQRIAPGAVAREVFVEYDPSDLIFPQLRKHGFVHSAPGKIEDGREYWDVRYTGTRSEIETALDAVRDSSNADIKIARIGAVSGGPREVHQLETLTPRQREVFELARERGYYNWPRDTSTRKLAAALDISKTTFLEHLRKAEAKLLDP
ncbi:transcriptional regulator [Haloferax mediterranei ATCC 33500]|uniref:Transcription regulator n=1 Tax=Haloferax mediterranei (strain ATCC 33500 / DSM 1411 / JCM 8866 / NBRC 14739 / NCIMB 2177 / R-4) TaxID=523841 RepID=I3R6J0_HALMT|nr:helix-turn-helix domain-containing protein [Haloferax mediterranei]AFK19850.1 transcription regulator [Haloferax mediterranei ATCC 33500]AHZ23234.1 transcriptional regulator [Haloferax mediterranei ATCC 33500]ELZ99818.1 transcriptional regulator [Haloferax mediterranei ATCC 33500]MDX5987400.1 helix-turn-helix domain-containing protein [Haloferax mediterranei ATCC 33500]QCQ73906.1 transcriptional regulator [Haloferax mediterranei ATCC 33500]